MGTVHLGCYNQNPIDVLAQAFISHSSGEVQDFWEVQDQMPADVVSDESQLPGS